MAKAYKGNQKISQIEPATETERRLIRLRLNPGDINYLQKVIDSHTHLGFLTQINPKEGLVNIHTTPDTYPEMMNVLKHFPRPFILLHNEKSGIEVPPDIHNNNNNN